MARRSTIATTVTATDLVVRIPDVRSGLVSEALKEYVLEAFRIPSVSMIPTLRIDDNVFVLKGGAIKPGDVKLDQRYATGNPIIQVVTSRYT